MCVLLQQSQPVSQQNFVPPSKFIFSLIVSHPPVLPSNLQFSHEEGTNTVMLQWSHENSEISVTDFTVSIEPNPISGSCAGGQCIVHPRSCMIVSTTNTICTFNVTELEHNILYSVNVRAMNCNGQSDATDSLAIIILTTSELFNIIIINKTFT